MSHSTPPIQFPLTPEEAKSFEVPEVHPASMFYDSVQTAKQRILDDAFADAGTTRELGKWDYTPASRTLSIFLPDESAQDPTTCPWCEGSGNADNMVDCCGGCGGSGKKTPGHYSFGHYDD